MSPRNAEETARIKDVRRLYILMAALKVFAQKGLHASKMTEIAEEAGVSNGLAYHYFDSKEAIFHELVSFSMDGSIGVYRDALNAPGTAWDKLRALVDGIIPSAYQGNGRLFFLIMIQAITLKDIPPQTQKMVEKRSPEYLEIISTLIKNAQAEGTARHGDVLMLASALTSMIQGLAILSTPGYEVTYPDADTVLRMVKA